MNLEFEPRFEAMGGNTPGPNPGTGNNICFRLEGDGISPSDYATWKNNNIEIYIEIEIPIRLWMNGSGIKKFPWMEQNTEWSILWTR